MKRRAFITKMTLFALVAFADPVVPALALGQRGENGPEDDGFNLETNRERWKNLSPGERRRILANWKELKANPERLRALRESWRRFMRLSPDVRARVLSNYARWNKLTSTQKAGFREKLKKLRQLTPEQRRQLNLELQRGAGQKIPRKVPRPNVPVGRGQGGGAGR